MIRNHSHFVIRSAGIAVAAFVLAGSDAARADVLFSDDFEANSSNNVVPAGWSSYRNWTRGPSTTGTNAPNSFSTTGVGAGHPFYGHNWPDNPGRFVAASGNGASPSLIDLWLVSPEIQFNGAGAEVSFWAFSLGGSTASVEARLSVGSGIVPDNGGSYDNDLPTPLTGGVGDFEHLLLSVNPTRSTGGFSTWTPSFDPIWTEYTVTIPAGLVETTGHLAFRSFGSNVFGQADNYRSVALDTITVNSITTPQLAQWAVNQDGNWNTGANWTTGAAPSGTDAHVLLGSNAGVINAPRVVTNDVPRELAKLTFDHAEGYTVAGSETLSIRQQISALSGTHQITAPIAFTQDALVDVAAGATLALQGAVDAADRNIDKTGPGSLTLPALTANRLGVTNGSVAFTGTGQAELRSLVLLPRTELDVGRVLIALDYENGATSPRDTIRAAILSGQIDSADRAANQAIGYVDTAAVAVDGLDADTLLFGLTLKGDANLDLTVNFEDLLVLAQNYNSTDLRHWYQGDNTLDGAVNFDDLLALAQNYGASLVNGAAVVDDAIAAAFASDWALAQSLVPEPASLGMLLGLGALARRRRVEA